MIDLHRLYIFYRVAEQQHFTRAAEELFISQPAVSKQVRELEREIGLPLFETNARKKVQLTPAGQLVYQYAARVFKLVDELEQATDDLKGLRRGRLAVGSTTTIGTYLLPPVLGRYKAAYPQIDLFLDIGNHEQIQHKVGSGQLELGLVEGFVAGPELAAVPWQSDELVLIAAPDHPLSLRYQQGQELQLSEALTYPLFMREAGSGTREVLEKALHNRGLTERATLEIGSTEAIKKLVIAGLGLSFVSKSTIGLEEQVGLLVRLPLVDLKVERTLWLVHRKDRHFSPAAKALLDLLELS